MSVNLIFAIVFGVIVVALVVWIAVIYSRAKQVSDASDARLNARLYAAAATLPSESASDEDTRTPADSQPPLSKPAAPVVRYPMPGSPDAAPSGPKDARLAELGDLHERGLISDGELAAARAKILAE
jgi:hypothetical protein